MSDEPVIIVGAGGHAAVVADALIASGQRVLGFIDNDVTRHGQQLCGLPLLGGDEVLANFDTELVALANGIGGTKGESQRSHVQKKLEAAGWRFSSVQHPSAVISPFAQLHDKSHPTDFHLGRLQFQPLKQPLFSLKAFAEKVKSHPSPQ